MKLNFFRLLTVGVIGVFLSVPMLAQDRKTTSTASNLYLISAKAGGVNYVSGEVSIAQKGAKKVTLQKSDSVEVGDVVSTKEDGRAEILLNPGSYIRLGGNSEFEFVTTNLEEDLQLKVNRGSAIFEVIADKEFKIAINTPKARFYLIQSGVYRIDALENGAGRISVWKGKAQVGDAKATTVKGGKTAIFENMQATITKFDRDNKGEFENWSKVRAQEIAKINEKLQRREMGRSLSSSFNNTWDASNGYGLWVQDPFSRSFCFLPFGSGWRSPYGFGYNQSIWNYNPPQQIINTMYQNPVVNNPNNNSTFNPPNNNNNVPATNPSNNSGGSPSSPPVSQPPSSRGRDPEIATPRTDKRERDRPIDNDN